MRERRRRAIAALEPSERIGVLCAWLVPEVVMAGKLYICGGFDGAPLSARVLWGVKKSESGSAI